MFSCLALCNDGCFLNCEFFSAIVCLPLFSFLLIIKLGRLDSLGLFTLSAPAGSKSESQRGVAGLRFPHPVGVRTGVVSPVQKLFVAG